MQTCWTRLEEKPFSSGILGIHHHGPWPVPCDWCLPVQWCFTVKYIIRLWVLSNCSFCLMCSHLLSCFSGVLVLTFFVNKFHVNTITGKDQFIIAYGGLRGAICFSLVFLLPDFRRKKLFIAATTVVILFTVFIQVKTISVSPADVKNEHDFFPRQVTSTKPLDGYKGLPVIKTIPP